MHIIIIMQLICAKKLSHNYNVNYHIIIIGKVVMAPWSIARLIAYYAHFYICVVNLNRLILAVMGLPPLTMEQVLQFTDDAEAHYREELAQRGLFIEQMSIQDHKDLVAKFTEADGVVDEIALCKEYASMVGVFIGPGDFQRSQPILCLHFSPGIHLILHL